MASVAQVLLRPSGMLRAIKRSQVMALLAYRNLCPKSGHLLSADEREALRASEDGAGSSGEIRCQTCGQTVKACPDPGTGRFLVHSMHLRSNG
jgi:hypothetical protein